MNTTKNAFLTIFMSNTTFASIKANESRFNQSKSIHTGQVRTGQEIQQKSSRLKRHVFKHSKLVIEHHAVFTLDYPLFSVIHAGCGIK